MIMQISAAAEPRRAG